ncbi:MAG: N-acetyltransferase [Eubacteriaceae bacterium]
MIYNKNYNYTNIETKLGTIIIEGPVTHEQLLKYKFSQQLNSFRKPDEQVEAILEISQLPEGRIIIARNEDTIVGYATFLHPDPLERWSQENMDNLLELGAIEIANAYRGFSISKNILLVSMMDDAMEDYIIITTEYYWHWDLKGLDIDIWDYRKIMEKTMEAGGLIWFATDDEEITSHPANCLMARIGNRVDMKSIEKFDRLRFKYRFMY